MHLNYDLIFADLSLQLELDGFLFPLFLDGFFNKIKQLVLVSFHLALLVLDRGNLVTQLLLNLLRLISLVSQLHLESLLHIFLFVGLKVLQFVEGLNQVLVVCTQLFGLPLSSQHLDETVDIAVYR